jgi:anti-sigma B factor antagonist
MKIDQSVFGPVTVLTLRGKMTLLEGDDDMLKDRVNQLVLSGCRQFVFDMRDVPYIDSACNGEMVRSYTTIMREGGHMVMCNVPKRLQDLFAVQKLLSLYEMYDNLDDALRSFTSVIFDVSCPVCRPASWMPVSAPRQVTCAVCGGVFTPVVQAATSGRLGAGDPASNESPMAIVARVFWPTYGESPDTNEYARLTLGIGWEPTTIEVSGRLDRFVLDVTEMAWRAVPPPRRVLFDLTKVSNSSERARTQLEELCGSRDGDNRAVILVPSSESHLWRAATTYADRKSAVSALGSLDYKPVFRVSLRRRDKGVRQV